MKILFNAIKDASAYVGSISKNEIHQVIVFYLYYDILLI